MTPLTPHFSLEELTQTNTGLPNDPEAQELSRLVQLAMNMEHVRAILGHRPLYVTSAFRSNIVNRKVGGSPTSDHRGGYAVDFVPPITRLEAMRLLEKSWLPFDQLIDEPEQGIVHISFAPRFRRQLLSRQGSNYVPFKMRE